MNGGRRQEHPPQIQYDYRNLPTATDRGQWCPLKRCTGLVFSALGWPKESESENDVDIYTIILLALAVFIFLRGSIIPIPNVLAGILIGVAVNAWGELTVSCVGWSFAFCAHVWIAEHQRAEFTIFEMETRAHRLLFGSPAMTFYAIEWATALPTSLAVSAVTFIVRKMLF
jgi:hypothetical protein